MAALAVAEITQAEAQRRARLLAVRSYAVDLDLTRGESVFGSRTVIRFDCAEPGAEVHADLIAAAVHEITLNGSPLDPARACAGGRIALPGLAATNEPVVLAECAYTTSGTGMHRGTDSADRRVYRYAKFEPAYARSVFATFEQPDLTAPVRFSVTAPAHWTVLSNQLAEDQRPAGEGRVTRRFPPTEPLPTHNTTVVAGEYQVVRAEHVTPTAVLRQLMAAAGRDAFFAAIGDYLGTFPFSNASRSDLLHAVARRSGLDLSAWSRAWLETTGPARLRFEFTAGQDGRFTSFAVTQDPPPGDGVASRPARTRRELRGQRR